MLGLAGSVFNTISGGSVHLLVHRQGRCFLETKDFGWVKFSVSYPGTLKLTIFSPENRPFTPKGKEKVFQASIFRGENVSFREAMFFAKWKIPWIIHDIDGIRIRE